MYVELDGGGNVAMCAGAIVDEARQEESDRYDGSRKRTDTVAVVSVGASEQQAADEAVVTVVRRQRRTTQRQKRRRQDDEGGSGGNLGCDGKSTRSSTAKGEYSDLLQIQFVSRCEIKRVIVKL